MSKIISDFSRPPRRTPPQPEPQRPSVQQPVPARRMINQPYALPRRRTTEAITRPPARRQPQEQPQIPELESPSEPLNAAQTADMLPPVVMPTNSPVVPKTPLRKPGGKKPPRTPRKSHFRFKLPFKLTKKRVIIGSIVLLLLIAGSIIGYLNYTASKITDGGSIIDLITPGAKLKTDSLGRTNIVVFGTSNDDPDHQNADGGGGLWLTDSIMLVSINQANNTASTVSIPRDLWVKLDDTCIVGSSSRINAVYECASGLVNQAEAGSNYKEEDRAGAAALKKKITEVTGIVPQYYAHVNYSVLKDAVNAVGGIDVDIEGDGASGIYDTNFDWNCGSKPSYSCKHVYYPKDGTYTLNGTQALYLARARGDFGKYSYKNFGLARGDFDRQMNQQKILTALKEKAQSAGVLANPLKVFGLVNALGNNVTTDISTSEMKTFASTLQKLPKEAITSIDLAGDTPVVETAAYAGQSIVQATSGPYVYTSIIELIAKKLSTNPATAEEASIAIYNGGKTSGAATKLQTKLIAAGLSAPIVGNTDPVGSDTYTIYVTKPASFPKTISYLTQDLTNASVISTAEPSTVPTNTADIVIVINK